MSRLLILGAGISGLAAARLATKEGETVTLYDRQPSAEAASMGYGMAVGDWDPVLLEGADLVVTSPGFSERSAPIIDAVEAGVPIWSEIEYAWRHLRSPVIAVTGTNGKTSVTEAASAMLDASGLDAPATGNIGAPLSDFASDPYDVVVVEVSSFQLRFIDEFHPTSAGITNVAVDHLDWHGSAQAYREAKARVFENQTSTDLLVYDWDDPGASLLARRSPSRLFPISGTGFPQGGGGVQGRSLVVGDVHIDLADLTTEDPTHVANVAMAAALALPMGASPEGVAAGASAFSPGAHRRSLVLESGGVAWVDDSKATNPHAAVASMRAHRSVVLIAGGRSKGLDPTPLAEEKSLKLLIGIGEAGPILVEAAGEKGRLARSLDVAVEMAAQVATAGDTVLLAPGCASFDQFESYTERGERFAELVRKRVGSP